MKNNQNNKTAITLPEIEEAVLGAILIEKHAINKVAFLLSPASFSVPKNAKVYEAAEMLYKVGMPIDLLTVVEQLKKMRVLDALGGPAAVSEIATKVASSANIEYHARILAEAMLRREAIKLGKVLAKDMLSPDTDPITRAETATKELSAAVAGLFRGNVANAQQISSEMLKDIDSRRSDDADTGDALTGVQELDDMLGGLRAGEVYIVAGRPGMGKSAFALNIAKANAEKGITTLIFSLEMGKEQWFQRLATTYGDNITGDLLRNPEKMTEKQYDELITIIEQHLYNIPILIDDTSSHTAHSLAAIARNAKLERGIGCIIVDYLQLMSSGSSKQNSTREQDVSEISRSLKVLARDLNIPIVVLSQLNRGVEARADRRPQLSDLRESGAIEQDADGVMLLFRQEYYGIEEDEDMMPTKGICEVIVAKNRHGSVGSVKTSFEPAHSRFGTKDVTASNIDLPDISGEAQSAATISAGARSTIDYEDDLPF